MSDSSQPRPFITARTRELRTRSLNATEVRILNHIEQSGCSLMQVCERGDKTKHLFSYTIGIYDTCGQPELIVVGGRLATMKFLLNEAAGRLREGIELAQGRHADLLGNVECEFRPVDRKWIEHVMTSAVWYNGNSEFPALQAIYPDLDNRFPEDEDFNDYFTQPMLQPDARMTHAEEDFWGSNDPSSSLFNWKFPDPPHTRVFLSQTVHEGAEVVTYVSHDLEDGAWQFLGDSMDDGGGPVISCFHHPIDRDASLHELFDLPLGWCAERDRPGEPWIRRESPPSEESAAE